MAMKDWPSSLFLGVLAFSLPFELLILKFARLIQISLSGSGYWYIGLQPILFLMLASLFFYYRKRTFSDWAKIAIALMILGSVTSSIVYAADGKLALCSIVFGLLPIAAMILMIRSHWRDDLLIWFAWGISVWAFASTVVYLLWAAHITELIPTLRHTYSLSGLLLALRGPAEDFPIHLWYVDILGNMNKAANYALLGLVVVSYLFSSRRIGIKIFLPMVLMIWSLIFITFSRGVFLVSALCALGMLCLALMSRSDLCKTRIGRREGLIILIFLVPVLFSVSTKEFRQHWIGDNTMEARVLQWEDISRENMPLFAGDELQGRFHEKIDMDTSMSVLRVLFGYGPGNYGLSHFGLRDAGTHNLFLDIWTDSGLMGFIGFALLIIFSGRKAWIAMRKDPEGRAPLFGLMGLCCIAALGMREYSLSYLFVTSLGAIFVGIAVGLASAQENLS